ncbi:MAG: efflux RND transporter periplasmic adaptor subunit [Muribaculaceae bacterium]|nr:efflux RND transporter periplasmic adaptor subunit [Muribaculaceae bacterium]
MILSVLVASCSSGDKKAADSASAVDTIHNVFVTSVESVGGEGARQFVGVVEENRSVSAAFKTPGEIARVTVKEGDRVQAGQLLAQLDDEEYALGLKQLQVKYDQTASEIKRVQYLYEHDNVSKSEWEQASSGFEQLGLELQRNKKKFEYTKLYAPVSGYVTKVNFEKGEIVDAGTPVLEIMDDGLLEVIVDLPVREYTRRDQFVSFASHDKDGVERPLQLMSITPKADNNQLYTMRLRVPDNQRGSLTSGMTVNVVVTTNSSDGEVACKVPMRSIFNYEGNSCVWVLEPDSTISRRVVTVKEASAGDAIVTSGLNGSEQIVRAGVNSLHDREKVNVLITESDTNIGNLL